jgi:hypothetical protein
MNMFKKVWSKINNSMRLINLYHEINRLIFTHPYFKGYERKLALGRFLKIDFLSLETTQRTTMS